jgi:hypothetical protein
MKIKSFLLAIVLTILTSFGCQKSIKLNLPKYEPKLVLEFYLQDDQPLVCTLQESVNYTDTTKVKLIENALIVLSYNGVSDTLFNQPYIDQKLGKFYNYSNLKKLKLLPNTDYNVYVNDRKGREMRGKTRVNGIVPIKDVTYMYNDANQVRAILVFNDDESVINHYILAAFRNTPSMGNGLLRSFRFDDILFNGKQFSFDTGYDYEKGDTITGRLYHLTEEHYNFAESVSNAQSANGNPFGQPANILSNVTGGLGVFTTLNYDEKVVIID